MMVINIASIPPINIVKAENFMSQVTLNLLIDFLTCQEGVHPQCSQYKDPGTCSIKALFTLKIPNSTPYQSSRVHSPTSPLIFLFACLFGFFILHTCPPFKAKLPY